VILALPEITTPETLAEHMGWSARHLRKVARELGACRLLGNRMVLTADDVETILEASRPRPFCTRATRSEEPLLDGSYEDLQRLRARKLPNEWPRPKRAR
jgi:hypothetical protein